MTEIILFENKLTLESFYDIPFILEILKQSQSKFYYERGAAEKTIKTLMLEMPNVCLKYFKSMESYHDKYKSSTEIIMRFLISFYKCKILEYLKLADLTFFNGNGLNNILDFMDENLKEVIKFTSENHDKISSVIRDGGLEIRELITLCKILDHSEIDYSKPYTSDIFSICLCKDLTICSLIKFASRPDCIDETLCLLELLKRNEDISMLAPKITKNFVRNIMFNKNLIKEYYNEIKQLIKYIIDKNSQFNENINKNTININELCKLLSLEDFIGELRRLKLKEFKENFQFFLSIFKEIMNDYAVIYKADDFLTLYLDNVFVDDKNSFISLNIYDCIIYLFLNNSVDLSGIRNSQSYDLCHHKFLTSKWYASFVMQLFENIDEKTLEGINCLSIDTVKSIVSRVFSNITSIPTTFRDNFLVCMGKLSAGSFQSSYHSNLVSDSKKEIILCIIDSLSESRLSEGTIKKIFGCKHNTTIFNLSIDEFNELLFNNPKSSKLQTTFLYSLMI